MMKFYNLQKALFVALALFDAIATAVIEVSEDILVPLQKDEAKITWGYKEADGLTPAFWNTEFPQCSGHRQSPIDLNRMKYSSILKPLQLINYNKVIHGLAFSVFNNGHSVGVEFDGNNHIEIKFQCDTYIAHSFHFHWGHYDQQGSEHLLEGRAFPLEMHIIHWKQSYGSFANALKHSDGLLVWGHFFKLDHYDNDNLNLILDHAADIKKGGSKKQIPTFALGRMLAKNEDGSRYYHYKGSLTTPGCNEIVLWVVNQRIQTVSRKQLDIFRSFLGNNLGGKYHKLLDNYRPIQPRNRRIVYSTTKHTPTHYYYGNKGHYYGNKELYYGNKERYYGGKKKGRYYGQKEKARKKKKESHYK